MSIATALRAEFDEHLETIEQHPEGVGVRFRRGTNADIRQQFAVRVKQLHLEHQVAQPEHQCRDCSHYRRGWCSVASPCKRVSPTEWRQCPTFSASTLPPRTNHD